MANAFGLIDDSSPLSIKQDAEFRRALEPAAWRWSVMTRGATGAQPSGVNAAFSVASQIFESRPVDQLQDARATSLVIRVNGSRR